MHAAALLCPSGFQIHVPRQITHSVIPGYYRVHHYIRGYNFSPATAAPSAVHRLPGLQWPALHGVNTCRKSSRHRFRPVLCAAWYAAYSEESFHCKKDPRSPQLHTYDIPFLSGCLSYVFPCFLCIKAAGCGNNESG